MIVVVMCIFDFDLNWRWSFIEEIWCLGCFEVVVIVMMMLNNSYRGCSSSDDGSVVYYYYYKGCMRGVSIIVLIKRIGIMRFGLMMNLKIIMMIMRVLWVLLI